MIRTIEKLTKQEAQEYATNLLLKGMKAGGSVTLTEHTIKPTSYDEKDLLSEDPKQGEELYSLIHNETTGKRVLYFSLTSNEYYDIVLFEPEEWGNYTYPFKNLQDDKVYIAVVLNALFLRPVKALSPDEANSGKGRNVLSSYFGSFPESEKEEESVEELQAKNYTIETAFAVLDDDVEEDRESYPEDWEDNLAPLCTPTPVILEKATGVKVKDATGYAKAVSKLLSAPLDPRQEKAVTSHFEFAQRDHFLQWLIYEFARTESYSQLQENLKEYKKFRLPKDWAKDCVFLKANGGLNLHNEYREVTPEEYVVAKYLSKDAIQLIGTDSQRELARVTGIPLPMIIKAYKRRIWDF